LYNLFTLNLTNISDIYWNLHNSIWKDSRWLDAQIRIYDAIS
jgi:hypothetical protein